MVFRVDGDTGGALVDEKLDAPDCTRGLGSFQASLLLRCPAPALGAMLLLVVGSRSGAISHGA